MARIPLTNGFVLIPEGEYVFKITEVNYDEEFGKMEIKMVTPEGYKHTERFSLLDNTGEINERALNAFSYFAKTALNDFNAQEIDEKDLVGKYLRAAIIHNESTKSGKRMTFANMGDKSPADASDFSPEKKPENNKAESVSSLFSLLGRTS